MKLLEEIKKTAPFQVARPFYREFIYWMHTPASRSVKHVFFFLWAYGLAEVLKQQLSIYGSVYKRKRMRDIELQKSELPRETKEMWEV